MLVKVVANRFDLSVPADRARWVRLPVDLARPVPADVLEPVDLTKLPVARPADVRVATLTLRPEDGLLVGTGDPAAWPELAPPADKKGASRGAHGVDRVPLTERRIAWGPDGGSVRSHTLLPAAGIKGALRHRVAFHHRMLTGRWLDARENDPAAPQARALEAEADAAVAELFGTVKSGAADDRPGRVFIDDVWLEPADLLVHDHVSIDRFIGGPMDGLLFSEATLHPRSRTWRLHVEITVNTRGLTPVTGQEADPAEQVRRRHVLTALDRALADLYEGRLALGAASGRGNGWFQGEITWTDKGAAWRLGDGT